MMMTRTQALTFGTCVTRPTQSSRIQIFTMVVSCPSHGVSQTQTSSYPLARIRGVLWLITRQVKSWWSSQITTSTTESSGLSNSMEELPGWLRLAALRSYKWSLALCSKLERMPSLMRSSYTPSHSIVRKPTLPMFQSGINQDVELVLVLEANLSLSMVSVSKSSPR